MVSSWRDDVSTRNKAQLAVRDRFSVCSSS
jgi:hypothetical protein